MAKMPDLQDPTLVAVDKAIEASQKKRDSNGIGMGSIGNECERRLWYDFRWVSEVHHKAKTLKLFVDGHQDEDLMASRLRLVDGITLYTVDPQTGRQIRVEHFGGHLSGYLDGVIIGILEAPKTHHVWEHKTTAQDKFSKLTKLKHELGEKMALKAWNPVYYAQGVLYMHFTGLARHYMTVSTPGGRNQISVRTNADTEEALRLIAKAERIVDINYPPARISEDPTFYLCKWCNHADVCHEGEGMRATCRSCAYVTPNKDDGTWFCTNYGATIPTYEDQQQGCDGHLFNPELIKGECVDGGEGWTEYQMPDGTTWRDGEQPEIRFHKTVEIDGRHCKHCGSVRLIIEPGKGPHAAHLRCEACKRGGQWLSKHDVRGLA